MDLVPGWMTVFGRVNHLGTKPGTQAYSAWDHPLWLGWNEYLAKAGHIAWYISPWSCSVCWMPGWWLASRDQGWLTGSGRALEACPRRCTVQIHSLLYFTLQTGKSKRPHYFFCLHLAHQLLHILAWRLELFHQFQQLVFTDTQLVKHVLVWRWRHFGLLYFRLLK